MSAAPRKAAPRLARPAARYRRGQAPKGYDAAPSESDEDEEAEEQEQPDEGDVLINDAGDIAEDDDEDEDGLAVHKDAGAKRAKGAISVALRDVNISKEGKVIVGGKEESGRTAAELERGMFACSYGLARAPR